MTEQARKPYRILSIEGGGFRSVISAVMLKEVDNAIKAEYPGKGIRDYFHLIAGTSAGSILAAGIALGKSPDELLEIYRGEDGRKIFPRSIWRRREGRIMKWPFVKDAKLVCPGMYPLYPMNPDGDEGVTHVLKKHLSGFASPEEEEKRRSRLKDKDKNKAITLKELNIDETALLIPAYHAEERFLEWFSNFKDINDSFFSYKDVPIWKLCACSSAAPTFFPPMKIKVQHGNQEDEKYYIDGGVAANNPALLAIAKAMRLKEEVEIQDISVLSIGTGRVVNQWKIDKIESMTPANWATKLGDFFLPAPNRVTDDICWQLIRGDGEKEVSNNRNRFLSLNPNLDLDDEISRGVESLETYGHKKEHDELQRLAKIIGFPRWKIWAHRKFRICRRQETLIKELQDKARVELGTIDNPELFPVLERIATSYLDSGKVQEYSPDRERWGNFANPKEAITNFIEHNSSKDCC